MPAASSRRVVPSFIHPASAKPVGNSARTDKLRGTRDAAGSVMAETTRGSPDRACHSAPRNDFSVIGVCFALVGTAACASSVHGMDDAGPLPTDAAIVDSGLADVGAETGIADAPHASGVDAVSADDTSPDAPDAMVSDATCVAQGGSCATTQDCCSALQCQLFPGTLLSDHPAPATFACGTGTCPSGDYCEQDDTPGFSSSTTCHPMPSNCSGCNCFAHDLCSCGNQPAYCTQDTSGNVTISCDGCG